MHTLIGTRAAVLGLVLAWSCTAASPDFGAVELLRDRWGIPHVFADTDRGAFYGLGYAAAQERGFQMTYGLRIMQGRLAELLGDRSRGGRRETTLDHDRRMRTFGWARAGVKDGTTQDTPKFSHAWVVGGPRTTTGSAVLVSDPQTPVRNPSLWMEFHIKGKTLDPRAGFLLSANHRAIGSFYPIALGTSTGSLGDTIRSWRLRERPSARSRFSPADARDIHDDAVNPARREIVRLGLHLRSAQPEELSDASLKALARLEPWLGGGASTRPALGWFDSLDGFGTLDPTHDVPTPGITCLDGQTIHCQSARQLGVLKAGPKSPRMRISAADRSSLTLL